MLLVFLAGLACGAVNALAGGGSLILFPALIATGMGPLAANVTNSVSTWPGYLGSSLGFRTELEAQRHRLPRLAIATLGGSAVGCTLLLVTPPDAFDALVPLLVLLAAVLLAIQPAVARRVGQPVEGHVGARRFQLAETTVTTPITETVSYVLAGKKVAVIPILRAGLGMVDGILELIPAARVGHVGLYRDPKTLKPVEYYCKLPDDIAERDVLIVDPMLATGGSAVAAIELLREKGAKHIDLLVLIAAPEGIEEVVRCCEDITIYTCSIDSHLNKHGYIVPGLGDAGDRIFGTK